MNCKELNKYFNMDKFNTDAEVLQNRERVIERLIEAPGIGSVGNIAETTIINNKMEELMENLSSHLTKHCAFGFHYKTKLSGSVSEGSKVGFPDEYDYLVMLEGLCDQLTPEENKDTCQGYVMLKFKEDSVNEQLSTDGYFDARKFNLYFYRLAYDAICSVFSDIENDFCLTPDNRIFEIFANFKFCLEYPSQAFGDIKISVDFVPVTKLPLGWRPNHFNNKVQLKEDHLCVLLMKPAKGGNSRYEPGFCEGYERGLYYNQLRISTSLIETQIITQLPIQIKRAFIALKALHNETYTSTITISTYVFKTAVMSYAEHIKGNREKGRGNVFSLTIAILKHYTASSFFFPGMKIVDESFVEQTETYVDDLVQFCIKLCK